jgi:hypothetical protein
MDTPWLTVMALGLHAAAGLALLSLWSKRLSPDRRLRGVIAWSYGLRVVMAAGLFVISSHRWPLFEPMQTAPGFWMFAMDSQGYDVYARLVADAWDQGTDLPYDETRSPYLLVVALIYRLLGAHPLHPILLNCWLATASGLLAYAIGRMLADHRRALTAAVLVSWWPSSLVWSSQLLKDPLSWCLALLACWLLGSLLPTNAGGDQPPSRWWWGRVAGFGVTVAALTLLRHYLGVLFWVAVLLVLGPAILAAWWHRRWTLGCRYGAVIALTCLASVWARTLDLFTMVSPRQPAVSYLRLAGEAWRRQDFLLAQERLTRLHDRYSDYPPTYLGEGLLALAEARDPEAQQAYHIYLALHPDPIMRRRIERLLTKPDGVRHAEALFLAATQDPPPYRPLASRSGGEMPSASEIVQAQASALQATFRYQVDQIRPDVLGNQRREFIASAGRAASDRTTYSDLPSVLRMLPRSLWIGCLAPFPNQWMDEVGGTGIMRRFSSIEMVWIYGLLLPLAVGSWRILRERSVAGLLLLTYAGLTAAALSAVVVDLASLFRMRVQYMLPMAIIAALGDPAMRYRWFWKHATPAGSNPGRGLASGSDPKRMPRLLSASGYPSPFSSRS